MDEKLNKILSNYNGKKSELIPILQDIQSNYGYLPENIILKLSNFLKVPESEIYGVATFYSQFRFTPIGKKHIMVCTGTACHVQGAPQILEGIERHLGIKGGDVTLDLEYSLESVGCLGCCALAPCAMVNDKVESKISLKSIKRLFSKRKTKEKVNN